MRWNDLLQFELHTSCSRTFLCLQGHWCKCATHWKEPVAIKQISLPFPSKVSLSCPWLRLIEHKFSFRGILNINTKQFVSELIAWLCHLKLHTYVYETMYINEELRGKIAVKIIFSWLDFTVVVLVILSICVLHIQILAWILSTVSSSNASNIKE